MEATNSNSNSNREKENVTSAAADGKKPLRLGGKSCKGCLFYSSVLNSKSQSPFCIGLSRTLKQVPDYVVSSDSKVSKGNQIPKGFRYACVGYSVHLEKNMHSTETEKQLLELPFCVGIEILSVKKASNPDHAPAHFQKEKVQEDGHTSRPESHRRHPMKVPSNEFLYRFAKNAEVVGMGVKRNILRVSSRIKKTMDNALDPYKRRSK